MKTRTINRTRYKYNRKNCKTRKNYKQHMTQRPYANKELTAGIRTESAHSITAPKAKDMPKNHTLQDREVQEIQRSIIALKKA